MTENKTSLPIIVNDSDADNNSKNMFPTSKRTTSKISEIQIDYLQANIKDVIDKTLGIFDNIHQENHNYEIDSVTIHLNISSGGKVSLVGEVSSGLTSGLTVVLKKQNKAG